MIKFLSYVQNWSMKCAYHSVIKFPVFVSRKWQVNIVVDCVYSSVFSLF